MNEKVQPSLSRSWGIPEFLDNHHMKVATLSALRIGRLYPQEIPCYLFLLEAESTPGPKCGRKDYVNEKSTPSGIKPATFWLGAQCLNQLRHCVTFIIKVLSSWIKRRIFKCDPGEVRGWKYEFHRKEKAITSFWGREFFYALLKKLGQINARWNSVCFVSEITERKTCLLFCTAYRVLLYRQFL